LKVLETNRNNNSNSDIIDIENEIEELENKKQNINNELSKAEIKVISASIKGLKKELKKAHNYEKEPKHILDYVNKCFDKKKRIVKVKPVLDVMSA
jgi:hypothetical protein